MASDKEQNTARNKNKNRYNIVLSLTTLESPPQRRREIRQRKSGVFDKCHQHNDQSPDSVTNLQGSGWDAHKGFRPFPEPCANGRVVLFKEKGVVTICIRILFQQLFAYKWVISQREHRRLSITCCFPS